MPVATFTGAKILARWGSPEHVAEIAGLEGKDAVVGDDYEHAR